MKLFQVLGDHVNKIIVVADGFRGPIKYESVRNAPEKIMPIIKISKIGKNGWSIEFKVEDCASIKEFEEDSQIEKGFPYPMAWLVLVLFAENKDEKNHKRKIIF